MLTALHWNLKVTSPKNNTQFLDTKASAYLVEDVYRICFSNSKQKYYFEIPSQEFLKEDLIVASETFFAENRHNLEVAKCVRCGKWHVVTGQFCERCKVSVASSDNNGTEFDIDI